MYVKGYFVIFLDNYTHFCIAYPIVSKSGVFMKFKEFAAIAKTHFECKIKNFRSDNDTEYIIKEFLTFL